MEGKSPKVWPYSPNNSPLPLPVQGVLFTPDRVIELNEFHGEERLDELSGEALATYTSGFASNGQSLDAMLASAGAEPLSERRPLLLQGELANPYRLQEMGFGVLPILPVRLEGLCRTWSDGLDSRDTYPGVHHVTLARTSGWWEPTHLGLVTTAQLRAVRDWLDNGVSSTWKAVRLGEGCVRFEHDASLEPPQAHDVEWDGTKEHVAATMPSPTGPVISQSDLIAMVHTRQGCYNNRGRLARCAHIQQRPFHDNLFRRGSSFRWDQILTTR